MPSIADQRQPDQTAATKSPKRSERILAGFAVAAVFLTLWQVVPLILIPYEIDYGEGLMLDGGLRIRRSEPLYPNPYQFPIVLHDWGPVAYVATAAVLPHGAPSFPAGRWLVLGCGVVLAIVLQGILRKLGTPKIVALAFGFLLLTLPAFRFWLYLLRADVIGVVLVAIGIWIYISDQTRWYRCVPLFLGAIFCKYTLVAAPAGLFLDLLLNRRTRQALCFAGTLGGATALAFFVAQRMTGGWFAFHMFSTHSDRYSLAQFLTLAGLVWASAPVVTGLALWYVIRNLQGGSQSFATLYFITSALTSLSAGKLGSATNHFVEWMIASCLCAGLAYAALLQIYPARGLQFSILLGVSVVVAAIAQTRPGSQPLAGLSGCPAVYDYVRSLSASRVLSETLAPTIMAGKAVQISDPFIYGQLVRHGLWPDHRVEDLIGAKYFDMVVLTSDPSSIRQGGTDVWPPSLVEEMQRNYRVSRTFSCRNASVVLEPIPPESTEMQKPEPRDGGTKR